MNTFNTLSQLSEIATRIKELREIMGFSVKEMTEKTDVDEKTYLLYESGNVDIPFSFIHKCALSFGVEMTELLEGSSAKLSTYTVTRKGQGQETAKEDGINIYNLAPKFKDKLAEPYYVKYEYNASQQNKPIHLTTHSGQEFDLVLSGKLKVQVGNHVEILEEGDSIYYNSSTPHGMIAVDGKDCVFCAVVMSGDNSAETVVRKSVMAAKKSEKLVCEKFVDVKENSNGQLESIKFKKLPAAKVLSIFHKGAYEEIGEAYAFIMKYAEENGYKVAGLARESYIDGIWNKDKVEDWLTEVQLPVE